MEQFIEIKAINHQEVTVSLDGVIIDRPYQDDRELLEVMETLHEAYPNRVKFYFDRMRPGMCDKALELAGLQEGLDAAKAVVKGFLVF